MVISILGGACTHIILLSILLQPAAVLLSVYFTTKLCKPGLAVLLLNTPRGTPLPPALNPNELLEPVKSKSLGELGSLGAPVAYVARMRNNTGPVF